LYQLCPWPRSSVSQSFSVEPSEKVTVVVGLVRFVESGVPSLFQVEPPSRVLKSRMVREFPSSTLPASP